MASDSRRAAAWRSALFFLVAPGVMAGLVPWLVTGYDHPGPPVAVALGSVMVVAGLAALLACFVRFVREGRGTPAPVAPTRQLVVGGLYRWVRNPMYLAVAAIIAGQAVLFTSLRLLAWLAVFGVAVVTFVMAYEEPTLRETYGDSYDAYRAAVPGWWPRLMPWRGDG